MKVLLAWAMRMFFKRVQNKMADQMKNQANQNRDSGFQQQGDVFVKSAPKEKKKKIEPEGGEYVDFEEVKD